MTSKAQFQDAEEQLTFNYKEILAKAGMVHLDTAQSWGKGIIGDFKRTVGTHWVEVSPVHQLQSPLGS